jgi:2-keto-4-pentenoate hydratase/2-oxohepta-3-ene-1,7-dioic acid hydratase in catechol pathway
MKLCRFQPQVVPANAVGATTHPEVLQGIISGETVREVSGDIFGRWKVTDRSWALADVKLLPPVNPSKIVCLGRNYKEHAAEFGNPLPKEPIIFLKPTTSLLAPGDPIILPPSSQRVDFEGELAVVMSKHCFHLREDEDVRPYILGYTCLNDVSARDLQAADKQWTRAKSFDTFCPLGPVLETEFDLASSQVETLLNGVRKQHSALTEMVFPVDAIIRFVAQVMTLLPGDVVATGTPAGVGPMQPGDVVEVAITGIGTLRNPVVASSA